MTPNPCDRQGHHVFLAGELGFLHEGDRCACGQEVWHTTPGEPQWPVQPRKPMHGQVEGVSLLGHRTSGWSPEQQQRNKDAAELLSQVVSSNRWEEDFIDNLTLWLDTGKPVTERQLDCLRRIVNGDYKHYTDERGYF